MSNTLTKIPVFYSAKMVADTASFSPSAAKPEAAVESWLQLGIPIEVHEPVPVDRQAFYRAHDPAHVDAVLELQTHNGFGNRSASVAASLPYTSGAMFDAAKEALENGAVACAPCSGFHHAGYRNCDGFCTFNGLLVAALALKSKGLAKRVGILDCDQHYGDGTDKIIRYLKLDCIKHFSVGQHFSRHYHAPGFLMQIPAIMESFTGCDMVLYQAGADPHIDDPLGGWLTTDQLMQRDLRVFSSACALCIPIAWNLAGGYQQPLRRVLDIHDNTMRTCWSVFGKTHSDKHAQGEEP